LLLSGEYDYAIGIAVSATGLVYGIPVIRVGKFRKCFVIQGVINSC